MGRVGSHSLEREKVVGVGSHSLDREKIVEGGGHIS
jgi:hypothetical protein